MEVLFPSFYLESRISLITDVSNMALEQRNRLNKICSCLKLCFVNAAPFAQ